MFNANGNTYEASNVVDVIWNGKDDGLSCWDVINVTILLNDDTEYDVNIYECDAEVEEAIDGFVDF